jgi:hypothetical protein
MKQKKFTEKQHTWLMLSFVMLPKRILFSESSGIESGVRDRLRFVGKKT